MLIFSASIHAQADSFRPYKSLSVQLRPESDDRISLESYKKSGLLLYFIAAYKSNGPLSRRAIGPERYQRLNARLRAMLSTTDEKDCSRPFEWTLRDSARDIRYRFCPSNWPKGQRDRLEKLLAELIALADV